MPDINQAVVWIKNPLAIFAENSDGGVVIQDQKILELVPQGATPKSHIDEVYDASSSVLLLGLINTCLLYTSDAADDLLCVDHGGRRINKN